MPRKRDAPDTNHSYDEATPSKRPYSPTGSKDAPKSEDTVIFEIINFSKKLEDFKNGKKIDSLGRSKLQIRNFKLELTITFVDPLEPKLAFASKYMVISDKHWRSTYNFSVQILSYKPSMPHLTELWEGHIRNDHLENHSNFEYKNCQFIADPKNGYSKDDVVRVKTRIWMIVPKGVAGPISKLNNFAQPSIGSSAGKILLNDRVFYVNRDYLALTSQFFTTLFFGDFSESHGTSDQVEIHDCPTDEFLLFLNAVYPYDVAITLDNLDTLLRMASRFEAQTLLNRCEKFILEIFEKYKMIRTSITDAAVDTEGFNYRVPSDFAGVHVYELLLYCDKYNLKEGMAYGLNMLLSSRRCISRLYQASIYPEFSKDFKLKLADSMAEHTTFAEQGRP